MVKDFQCSTCGKSFKHNWELVRHLNRKFKCKDPQEIRTAYVTTAPCVSCTKLLLNTSCKTIVFLESYPNSGRKIWNRSWIKHGSIRHVFTKIELETTD